MLLSEACKKSLSLINRIKSQNGAEKFIENIIKNLAEAEVPNLEKNLFTQDLLENYFHVILSEETSVNKLKSVFEVAFVISCSKPLLAKTAIENWIKLLANKGHSVYTTKEIDSKLSVEAINETIAGIFGNLFSDHIKYDRSNLRELHNLLEKFIRASGYYNAIRASYGYRFWHCKCNGYVLKTCCPLQTYLKDIVVQYLKYPVDDFQLKFALTAYDDLMELDFHEETYTDSISMTMYFSNYVLTECPHTKKYRLDLVTALIEFYNGNRAASSIESVFDTLTHQLYLADKISRERNNFNVDDELFLVIEFLKNLLSNNPTLHEKIRVDEVTIIYTRESLIEVFVAPFKELKVLSTITINKKEELEFLLNSRDYFDNKKNAGKKFLQILLEYENQDKFELDFIAISERASTNSPFYECIFTLVNEEPAVAKSLLDTIIKKYPAHIPLYSSLIMANYKDELYFYTTIQYIFSRHPEHLRTIIWMLTYGRKKDPNYVRRQDLDFFEVSINENVQECYDYVGDNLIRYALVDTERVFNLYNKLVGLYDKREVSGMLYHVFLEKAICSKFKNELKKLLYKNIDVLPIDENFAGSEICNFINDNFGLGELYAFTRQWVSHKVSNRNYGLFSFSDRVLGSHGKSATNEVDQFIFALHKFIDLSKSDQDSKLEWLLIKLFRPIQGFDSLLTGQVLKLFVQIKSNPNKVWALGRALSIFHTIQEPLVLFLCQCAQSFIDASTEQISPRQINDFFGFDFLSGGARSKVGSGPFPQDLQKKELLEKILREHSFHILIDEFLNKRLSNVHRDIQEDIDSDLNKKHW